MERRLAAIVSTDIVGYSRLMGADEAGTLARMKAHRRELWTPVIEKHGGRIVGTAGDSLLVEFASAVSAVESTIEVQQGMAERNQGLPDDQRMQLRVGVNIGEVIVDGDDIYGDGVNVAARMQEIAEPGGIAISDIVRGQVHDKLDAALADDGAHEVKNIAKPVHVWRWHTDERRSSEPLGDVEDKALPLPDKPSIAVLPFDNLSGDPEQDFFADGLVEEIITALAKISEIFVIARNSSFAYKGTSPDIRDVSRELGVRNVLEGSVRTAGKRVRVAAQLIDAATGRHLWAERYDRELTDVFELQDEITSDVVTTLQVRLTEGEQARLRRRQTNNVAAWECYVRAQAHIRRFNRADNEQARELFERAVELDPGFATAWCHLGWIAYNDARFGWCDSSEKTMERAAELVERGLALDADQPDAHSTLGIICLQQRRYDEAEAACAKALKLGQNSGDSCGLVAMMLNYLGQPEKAFSLIQKAMRLSPFYPDWYLGIAAVSHRLLGRHDEAEAADLKRLARNPDNAFSDLRLAALYEQTGHHDKARTHAKEALKKNPEWTLAQVRVSEPYRDPAEMERFIGSLRSAGLPE